MSDLLLCRICAKTQRQNLRKIFDEKNSEILENIEKLTGIRLKYGANLPQFICHKCYKDLKKAVEFRLRLHSAQYYFSTTQYLDKLELTRKNYTQRQSKFEVAIVSSTSDEVEHTISGEDESTQEHDTVSQESSKNADEECVNDNVVEKEGCIQKMICDICGKLFKNRRNLMKHVERHTGNKRFQCEYCEYKCYKSGELKIHIRKHTGERPYTCGYCNKQFTNQKNAKRHTRIHENERPYACTFCDKTFVQKCNLNIHMISHTGISRFNCKECGKAFQSKALLSNHYSSNGHLQRVAIQDLFMEIEAYENIE